MIIAQEQKKGQINRDIKTPDGWNTTDFFDQNRLRFSPFDHFRIPLPARERNSVELLIYSLNIAVKSIHHHSKSVAFSTFLKTNFT